MPVDAGMIGTRLSPVSLLMERGRLRAFATAIGETDPVYVDLRAARVAGHHDLPVPPTFLFGIELEQPDPFGWLDALGVDLRSVLHGEQRFDHHRVAHAGETLTASSRIEDVYTKRGGALEFVVKKTTVTDVEGASIADLTTVIVVRNPEVTR
jgi:hypothetical protein